MDRLSKHDPQSREPVRPCSPVAWTDRFGEMTAAADEAGGEHMLGSDCRLPPTRAARSARSRGVFLAAARRLLGPDKPERGSVPRVALAVAAVAATSVLIVSGPSVFVDTALAASRGLALIGAASVPPSFIAKKH